MVKWRAESPMENFVPPARHACALWGSAAAASEGIYSCLAAGEPFGVLCAVVQAAAVLRGDISRPLRPRSPYLSPGSNFPSKAPHICRHSQPRVTDTHKQSRKSRTRIMSQRERAFLASYPPHSPSCPRLPPVHATQRSGRLTAAVLFGPAAIHLPGAKNNKAARSEVTGSIFDYCLMKNIVLPAI